MDRTKKNKELRREQIDLVKGALKILKNDIKNMSEDELKDKKLDLLADLAKKFIYTNEKQEIKDMPPLESEGQGLKILIPKQLITRLPILLAQLKAGNNSEKLEVRNKIK